MAIQVEIDKINIELKGLIPTAADYAAKKLELDTKLLDLTKKMAAQTETDAKAVVKP